MTQPLVISFPFLKTRVPAGTQKGEPIMDMLFGEHKGKPLGEIPTDYLKWVLGLPDLRSQELRTAIEQELAKRRAAPGESGPRGSELEKVAQAIDQAGCQIAEAIDRLRVYLENKDYPFE